MLAFSKRSTVWKSSFVPDVPQAVLDLLAHHKADILRLLRPTNDGWSPEDWQVFFDERAAIAEFDGGLPRAEAERQALGGVRLPIA